MGLDDEMGVVLWEMVRRRVACSVGEKRKVGKKRRTGQRQMQGLNQGRPRQRPKPSWMSGFTHLPAEKKSTVHENLHHLFFSGWRIPVRPLAGL